jgi:hypothetical protein
VSSSIFTGSQRERLTEIRLRVAECRRLGTRYGRLSLVEQDRDDLADLLDLALDRVQELEREARQ